MVLTVKLRRVSCILSFSFSFEMIMCRVSLESFMFNFGEKRNLEYFLFLVCHYLFTAASASATETVEFK